MGRYEVYDEKFTVKQGEKDYNVIGIFYVKEPTGGLLNIYKFYFINDEDVIEIPKNIYDEFKRMSQRQTV